MSSPLAFIHHGRRPPGPQPGLRAIVLAATLSLLPWAWSRAPGCLARSGAVGPPRCATQPLQQALPITAILGVRG